MHIRLTSPVSSMAIVFARFSCGCHNQRFQRRYARVDSANLPFARNFIVRYADVVVDLGFGDQRGKQVVCLVIEQQTSNIVVMVFL